MTTRNKGKWLVWLAVISIAGAIGYGFLPKPLDVELVQPSVGPLEITVEDDGETRIRERYVLFAPVTGKMLRVKVHAGDEVHAGQTLLAHIEPSDPSLLDARSRTEAEARVRVATAAASQASAEVQRAREALELAKRNFSRAEKLMKSTAMARADYDAFENRLQLAYANVRSAESAERVAGYEIDQARAAIQYLESNFDVTGKNQFQVISPIDGKVLEVLREDSGLVTAGTPIAALGDAQNLEIVVDVLSTDAVQVEAGDEVVIQHWGGKEDLLAQVRLVEPSAFLKVSALGVEEKRVNVIADFVSPLEKRATLGDGFRIEAKIITERTGAETIKVPTSTLVREGDEWFVFRLSAQKTAEKVSVQVGKSSGLTTEVIKGLSATDWLVNHPTGDLREGVRLTGNE